MMLILKSISILIALLISISYIDGCSSAEQTTGKLAFQQGDYAKAEKEFEKELKQNPSNEEAWYYLGASRLMLNKFDQAKEAFDQYRKIGKNTYSSEILDAWIKRFNSGADKFEAGQKAKEPQDQIKHYNNAVNEFKICKVILPDSVIVDKYITSINNKIALITIKPHIDKGVELLEQEKYQESVDEFKSALTAGLAPDNPNFLILQYNIGVAYLKWGEKIRITNQEKNPDDQSHKEKYKEALTYLEAFSKSSDKKDQLQAYELLVQVYGNLNMQEKALEAIKIRDKLREEVK